MPCVARHYELDLFSNSDGSRKRTIQGNPVKDSIIGDSSEIATDIPLLLSNVREGDVRGRAGWHIEKGTVV